MVGYFFSLLFLPPRGAVWGLLRGTPPVFPTVSGRFLLRQPLLYLLYLSYCNIVDPLGGL